MIGYNRADSSDSSGHLFLIQAPESSGVTTEQLEQSLRDAVASGQESSAVETTTTEEIPVTIRGEAVTATVGTGTSGDNNRTVSSYISAASAGGGQMSGR